MAEGVKHDSEKPDYSLLPFGAVDEVVKALTYGSKKYDRFNWQKVEAHRYQAAALRHISAYMQGEKYDPETGLNHMAHAVCSLLFLTQFDLNEKKVKEPVYKPEDLMYNISYNVSSTEPTTVTTKRRLNDVTPEEWDAVNRANCLNSK